MLTTVTSSCVHQTYLNSFHNFPLHHVLLIFTILLSQILTIEPPRYPILDCSSIWLSHLFSSAASVCFVHLFHIFIYSYSQFCICLHNLMLGYLIVRWLRIVCVFTETPSVTVSLGSDHRMD